MPSGKVHAEVTLTAAGLIYLWGVNCGEAPALAAVSALGTASGILISPDLDVVGTRADKIVRGLGLIPALIWGILWRPYSALIPHRSVWSHGLLIGTVIRVAYIALPLALLRWLPAPSPELGRALLGLLISDNLHIGLDFLITGVNDYAENNK